MQTEIFRTHSRLAALTKRGRRFEAVSDCVLAAEGRQSLARLSTPGSEPPPGLKTIRQSLQPQSSSPFC